MGLCLSCLLVGFVLHVFPVSNLTKDRRGGVGGRSCAWFAVVVDCLALPFPQSPCSAMHLVHERSFKRGKPATSQPPAELTAQPYLFRPATQPTA